MKAMHCYVSGLVQGVFFREGSARQARALGLNGWVRNLRDGRVEFYAMGEEAALLEMKQWLQEGPPMAEVDQLECRDNADLTESLNDFRVLR
jgi:acylphosphatase